MALLSQDGGTGLAVLAWAGQAPVRNVLGAGALPHASVSTKAPLPSLCGAGAELQRRGASASLCLGVGGCACGYFPCKTSLRLPGWGKPGWEWVGSPQGAAGAPGELLV